jgi:hypothetical protein
MCISICISMCISICMCISMYLLPQGQDLVALSDLQVQHLWEEGGIRGRVGGV